MQEGKSKTSAIETFALIFLVPPHAKIFMESPDYRNKRILYAQKNIIGIGEY